MKESGNVEKQQNTNQTQTTQNHGYITYLGFILKHNIINNICIFDSLQNCKTERETSIGSYFRKRLQVGLFATWRQQMDAQLAQDTKFNLEVCWMLPTIYLWMVTMQSCATQTSIHQSNYPFITSKLYIRTYLLPTATYLIQIILPTSFFLATYLEQDLRLTMTILGLGLCNYNQDQDWKFFNRQTRLVIVRDFRLIEGRLVLETWIVD